MVKFKARNLSRNTKLIWIAVATLATAIQISLHGQAPKTTHQFEYYIPFYEFFDGTPTKWAYNPDRRSDAFGRGLKYTFGFKEKHFFSYSSSNFGAYYGVKHQIPPGEIVIRRFKLRTLDYHYRWLIHSRLKVDAFAGFTYRRGVEQIVVAYPRWWEIIIHSQDTRDWGIHTGMRAEYSFWKRFYASLQLSYTGYIRQYELGPPPAAIGRGPTKNQLALDVGIGYSLPRINFKKRPIIERWERPSSYR
jgi:hypothetical protein